MKTKTYSNSPALRNPALAFINTQTNVQDDVQEVTQQVKHKKAVAAQKNEPLTRTNAQDVVHDITHEVTQEATQEVVPEYATPKIRTQGRKGFKKPRINMAFDELDRIRRRADYEGKSVTQFVNDAVAFYLHQHR